MKSTIVFTDVDRTLAFPPAMGETREVVAIPGGISSVVAKATIEKIAALRKQGVVFCVVTGRRFRGAIGLSNILPLDHLLIEHGCVIIDEGGRPDADWEAVQYPTTGAFGAHEGPLWEFERTLQREGFATDSDGRWASFRVGVKANALSEETAQELLVRPLPEGITRTMILGDIDFLPESGGKHNAARFIAARYGIAIDMTVAMGDDRNDIELLGAAGFPATLMGATSEVIALVRERGGYVAPKEGHEGTILMLNWIAKKYNASV